MIKNKLFSQEFHFIIWKGFFVLLQFTGKNLVQYLITKNYGFIILNVT